MKRSRDYIFFLLLLAASLSLTCCRQSDKPSVPVEASRVSKADSALVSGNSSNKKAGEWVQKGIECYGIVIVNFTDGRTVGKAVRCKVMIVKPDQVKMKTIESVSLMESQGCDKLGLAYGDTWWEKEGDIFKTKEEAENYLKEKGWYIK